MVTMTTTFAMMTMMRNDRNKADDEACDDDAAKKTISPKVLMHKLSTIKERSVAWSGGFGEGGPVMVIEAQTMMAVVLMLKVRSINTITVL